MFFLAHCLSFQKDKWPRGPCLYRDVNFDTPINCTESRHTYSKQNPIMDALMSVMLCWYLHCCPLHIVDNHIRPMLMLLDLTAIALALLRLILLSSLLMFFFIQNNIKSKLYLGTYSLSVHICYSSFSSSLATFTL